MSDALRKMLRYTMLTCLWYGYVYLYSYDDTKKITDSLFDVSRYRVDIKPLRNQSDSVKVNVSHVLRSVTEVNVPSGYAVVESDMEIKWKDEYLVWNTSKFNRIEKLSLQADTFWTPVVTVIDGMEIENKYTPAWITHDGMISIFKTVTIKAKCIMEVSEYPFDKQKCYMKTMSIMHRIEDVQFSKGQVVHGIEESDLNKEWDIENITIQAKPQFKGGYCFSAMIVSFTIKRKLTFSTLQAFVLMNGMMLLNMLTPFVPPESGERITLCITIFLSFIVSSDSVNDEIPDDTTRTSLVMICILIYNFLNIVTVSWSVLIAHLYNRNGKVPFWLIRVLMLKSKANETYTIYETEQSKPNDESTEATDGDMETHSVNSQACTMTWQDVTMKMDKIYFLFFVGFYTALMITAGTVAASKGLI